jgi:hypothetical protein
VRPNSPCPVLLSVLDLDDQGLHASFGGEARGYPQIHGRQGGLFEGNLV